MLSILCMQRRKQTQEKSQLEEKYREMTLQNKHLGDMNDELLMNFWEMSRQNQPESDMRHRLEDTQSKNEGWEITFNEALQ